MSPRISQVQIIGCINVSTVCATEVFGLLLFWWGRNIYKINNGRGISTFFIYIENTFQLILKHNHFETSTSFLIVWGIARQIIWVGARVNEPCYYLKQLFVHRYKLLRLVLRLVDTIPYPRSLCVTCGVIHYCFPHYKLCAKVLIHDWNRKLISPVAASRQGQGSINHETPFTSISSLLLLQRQ